MTESTPRLLLPFIMAAQAQKHVTHNEALRRLDGLIQISVLDRDLATPPATPEDGAAYIVADNATGEWEGWEGDIACRSDGAWIRLVARPGYLAWVQDEDALYVLASTGWAKLAGVADP
ncbi:DUF2793 domain-containing protein [Roseinatronobacter sp.]